MSEDEEIKILCVDDEKGVLKALERLFLDSDYEIITADGGEEGLDILKKTDRIQLVISDYRMPGMNGVDFLREVCTIRPNTLRIVLSGYADTAAIVDAINEGQIYKFIPKPWNDEELKNTISKAMEHYFTNQQIIFLTSELEARNRDLQEINSNLEKIVEERTSDLLMQNRILTASQNILDSLPVGVIGIDPEGTVAQCNRMGQTIFSQEEGNIMGLDRRDSFPEDINAFIEKLAIEKKLSTCISKNGRTISVRGVYMACPGGQEGAILILDEEGRENGNCQ